MRTSPETRIVPRLLLAALSAAIACLLLGSCASTTVTTPPPGSAIIDAMPDADHRKQIEGIELVSINGKSVKGTRCAIKPGPNTIKTRFRWPHGLAQEADLRFYATPGIVYFINYDVYPPQSGFKSNLARNTIEGVMEIGPEAAVFLLAPAMAGALVGTTAQLVGHSVDQQGKTATRIDLMVSAHYSSQGTVRQVRVYPDGRVDEKPWAAWAQMKAP